MQDLKFILGVSLMEMEEYVEACEILKTNPKWKYWYNRSMLLSNRFKPGYTISSVNKMKLKIKIYPTQTNPHFE